MCDDAAMTLDEFRATLSAATPPAVSPALQALWHDARGARGEVVVTVGSGHYVFASSRSTGPNPASSSPSSISTAIFVSAVAVAALVAAGGVGFGSRRRRHASQPDLYVARLRLR